MADDHGMEPASAEATAAPSPRQMQIVDFAGLVADMNLFLTRLAALPPFTDSQIGVADWLVLNAMTRRQPTIPQLAKTLGIAAPRVKSIVDRLKTRNLVVGQASESASEVFVLAPDGQAGLDSMNAELQILFDAAADKFPQGVAGRDKSFFGVAKQLKFLLRMVALPSPEDAA